MVVRSVSAELKYERIFGELLSDFLLIWAFVPSDTFDNVHLKSC